MRRVNYEQASPEAFHSGPTAKTPYRWRYEPSYQTERIVNSPKGFAVSADKHIKAREALTETPTNQGEHHVKLHQSISQGRKNST